MAGGMVASGGALRKSALSSMQRYSSLDQKLKSEQEAMNKMDAIQEKQQNMQYGAAAGSAVGGVVGGMALGASATSWSGPGMVIGAAIGALIGTFAGDAF